MHVMMVTKGKRARTQKEKAKFIYIGNELASLWG